MMLLLGWRVRIGALAGLIALAGLVWARMIPVGILNFALVGIGAVVILEAFVLISRGFDVLRRYLDHATKNWPAPLRFLIGVHKPHAEIGERTDDDPD